MHQNYQTEGYRTQRNKIIQFIKSSWFDRRLLPRLPRWMGEVVNLQREEEEDPEGAWRERGIIMYAHQIQSQKSTDLYIVQDKMISKERRHKSLYKGCLI